MEAPRREHDNNNKKNEKKTPKRLRLVGKLVTYYADVLTFESSREMMYDYSTL